MRYIAHVSMPPKCLSIGHVSHGKAGLWSLLQPYVLNEPTFLTASRIATETGGVCIEPD